MFLETANKKVVQANKENLEFYNQHYEENKTEAAKQAALELEEYIRTHQPHILKKIFCCAKPYTGEEEDESIHSIEYSSGDSGDDENKLGRQFLKAKEREKTRIMFKLWYKVLAKAKGAVLVLNVFRQLTRRIYLFGTSKKLKYVVEQERKPHWYIILPNSITHTVWNVIVLLLLL